MGHNDGAIYALLPEETMEKLLTRLAAKLTGWKIDIKSQSQAEEDMDIADADSEADGGFEE